MKHPHADILKAYADDTSVEIEKQAHRTGWIEASIYAVLDLARETGWEFRIKPTMRSITLQDGTVVSWPEPMRVAPEYGTKFFVVDTWTISMCEWTGTGWTSIALKAGFCHLTEEAAQQHRKALALANGGEL